MAFEDGRDRLSEELQRLLVEAGNNPDPQIHGLLGQMTDLVYKALAIDEGIDELNQSELYPIQRQFDELHTQLISKTHPSDSTDRNASPVVSVEPVHVPETQKENEMEQFQKVITDLEPFIQKLDELVDTDGRLLGLWNHLKSCEDLSYARSVFGSFLQEVYLADRETEEGSSETERILEEGFQKLNRDLPRILNVELFRSEGLPDLLRLRSKYGRDVYDFIKPEVRLGELPKLVSKQKTMRTIVPGIFHNDSRSVNQKAMVEPLPEQEWEWCN